MGFLKGFLRKAEEEIADILPGGKTGKSIRAQRKAPVAKTVSRPRDESKSWLSKDFNPVSDGINDIKSAFKYASKDWKASEFQRQQDTQNANRQILKKYTQGQLNKNQVESLLGSKTKNAGLKKQGNLYVNTVKNGVGETLLQNTGAGIMNAAPQRVVGGLAEYGGTALGNDSIRDFGTRLNQPFRDYNALAYENAGNKTAAIGGNIAGNLLTLPIAPAGKAGLAYRGVVAGAPVAADTGYAIKQAGGGRVAQTVGGGATGIASGYLNSVGGDKLLKPVGAVTSKLVGKTVTTKLAPTAFGRIGAGVLNEGGEEVIEQGVDNAVAKSTYDPDRKLTDNLATSFLLGGAMGGVVRGGVELGNPTTRTQLINESKVKDIAQDNRGIVAGPLAGDFSKAKAEGKVFEGVDGKPRFEVDDSGAITNRNNIESIQRPNELAFGRQAVVQGILSKNIDENVAVKRLKDIDSQIVQAKKDARKATKTTLDKVLDHPELYKQYPDLKNMKVEFVKNRNSQLLAGYDASKDRILINANKPHTDTRFKETMLHEIQHAIQEREGFANGGDVRAKDYNNLAGEAEARAVSTRMNMTEGERYKNVERARPETTDNDFQNTLPSATKPSSIKSIVDRGGNPLYHDTTSTGVLGILENGEIQTSQAPFSSIVGQGKRVSTTRNFDNYSRYGKAPYRFVIDESKTNQKAKPDNREEFESIFNKNVKAKAIESLAIDITNPALINDIRDGTVARVISEAKAKGIKVEPFEGKLLPDVQANKEIQELTREAFNKQFPELAQTAKVKSTFYDSLDVPKEDLIIRDGSGKAMSVDKTNLSQEDLDNLRYGTPAKPKTETTNKTPDMPSELTSKIAKSSDTRGTPLEQVIFKEVKNSTMSNGAKNKIYNSMPDYKGWDKVFKPYGEQGKGFYYSRTAETNTSVDPKAPQVGKTNPNHIPPKSVGIRENVRNDGTSQDVLFDKRTGKDVAPIANNAEKADLIKNGYQPKEFSTPVAPVESKPTVTKKPTLQDALDGKSTKLNKPAPKKTVTEPKVAPVEPKRTEPAPKKPFIPDEVRAIRATREANTSQQNQSDQKRKNQQALRSKSSLQSQPESKVAPRTGVQPISQAVQGRVNNKSPQKARQGIGSIGKQKSLSGLSSKDTIQLSGVNVNDPFNNNKITKRLKNEFGRYFVDEDAEMINLMKRIEKETGQKDLVETWLQDSDLVRNTNSIANSKIRRNENLKLALRGLSKKQQRSFDEYASARTELSNLERGLESSSKTKEQLQQIVRDGNVDFGNRFIALNNYYGDWAKDLYDAGIIGKSKLDEWSKNKDYVRVQRDMEDILNYTPPTGKSRSFGTTSTSKKRTGSQREILSPTNVALERGQQLQLEIQRNKAASNTIDTLEKYGLAEKVSQQHATGKNVIKRFKDGKVEYFATSKDVKRVIENVNPFQLGVLGRVISTPTRLFRSGTTALSAPFATTNYARDQISSAIYSDQALPRLSKTAQGNVEYIAGTHSPKNIVSGIASATKDYFGGSTNPLWAKFEQVAGDQTQFDEMRNTRSSRATMRELRQGGKGELINKIVNPVRSMEDLIGITEKATRFQNFKGIYEGEMKRHGNEKIATQKASQAALQNSVNFTRAGKAMRVINLLLPYSNAGIQGSRNVARSFRKRPVATTMKSVAFVAVPTVLLTLMNYDDEETAKVYKNIDDTEKDDNFIIVLKGAKQNEAGSYEGIIKIPKPQGYRELTNPLRIAAERFAGNEKPGDVSKMVRDAISAFTGPVSIEDSGKFISSLMPQAVKPALQARENWDYYWDSQTVPDYMIDGTDDPTKRAYKSTSGTARIIANQLGVSPILVEKFIQDTTGSVGRYGINLTDRGLNKLGIVKDEQIGGRTITGDFKRRTTEARAIEKTNKTSGQRYYDNVEKATGDLPKYLQDSWKSYNTSNKNFLGEELFTKNGQAKKQAKAAAYIEHPELFDVDKKLDKLNRKKGETGNPLYDLSYNQALIVVQEKALPPGAKDEGLNALYDQQWYSQYKNKEEKYYDKIFGKGGIEENKDNPYPERSPDLISAMDYYYDLPSSYDKGAWKKANPDIASQMDAYYSAKDAWTNTERAKIGLPPIEDRFAKYGKSSGKSSSSGGRGGSRSGGRSSSSGSRKGKFDYKFGAFAPGEVGSKKSLRKILEEAQL